MPARLAVYHPYVSRPTRYALIALLLFSMTVTTWEFIDSVRKSTIFGADYDRLVSALWLSCVSAIAISYEVHRTRHPRTGTDPQPKKRWRQRVYLRAFLYCLATMYLLQLPLSMIKAEQRARRWQFPSTFWSELSMTDIVIPPILAAAIVIYDRRRLQREAREDYNLCPKCGYDLRASPTRCPECGTPVPIVSPETR